MDFLLTHNYFVFDRVFISSAKASMGAKFSPSLANLFMGRWEKLSLFSHSNLFTDKIIWYGRYIDDPVMVWNNVDGTLSSFVSYINDNDLNLEFSHDIGFDSTGSTRLTTGSIPATRSLNELFVK